MYVELMYNKCMQVHASKVKFFEPIKPGDSYDSTIAGVLPMFGVPGGQFICLLTIILLALLRKPITA